MKPSIDSFPNAPHGWSIEAAIEMATTDGIALSDHHWQLISALQEYYAKVEHPKLRQLKDALDEKFHARGGIK
jgi:sulfur relay (sulfurtransferase) DsrC/TusE family protein